MNTQFIGEHLWPGQLGHFFAIISFVGALFSAISYFISVRAEKNNVVLSAQWQWLGRGSFIVHVLAVFGIFSTLYYIIAGHLFEYHYAWEHSSLTLPTKYLLSCFWEGQEGSFMLWTIWHCVLGLIVMRTAKVLETRTMAIIALVQTCLATMLLGFYLSADSRIGSNPFMLLRMQMQGAPVFQMANYMSFIKDGNGLNVLLQNYWMVIHPPILFLGFASTLIPFAYCIAALWKGDYQLFVKPALNWSLFAGGVLGTGIMMGGAWAYESLTFGGYWAWDPVENASLVPWLVLVAGLHTLLVYKATKRTLTITFILYLLAYCLVWYSTFLTRTGVLGNTSVHAFTGEGSSLYWHLLVVLGILLLLSVVLLVYRWKSLPKIKSEEEISSREFWMFIGSFVLLLSGMEIIFATSLPVWAPLYKWLTNKDIAPPVNPVLQYNNIQVWVAIIIGVLSASILYLKFKHTNMKTVLKHLGITVGIAVVMGLIIGFGQKIDAWQYDILLFAACYAIIANIYYAFVVMKGKLKQLGPSIAHWGFGTVLLGILLSSYNKQTISFNTLGMVMDFGKSASENARESRENVLLFRNRAVAMGDYFATYRGDSTSPSDPRTFYRVDYERRDSVTHEVKESFTLYPDAFINPKGQQGLVANPASKHYLTKDIFTYVTSVIDPSKRTDTSTYKSYMVHKGDSIFIDNEYIVFKGFNADIKDPRYTAQQGDIAVAAQLGLYNYDGPVQDMNPIYLIRNQYESTIDDTAKKLGIYVRFAKVIPAQQTAEIQVRQTNPKDDYIVLKALQFPYINVLWLGVIIMVLGFFISLYNRATAKTVVVSIKGMKIEE
ncbi:MAG: cytochrome c biogenesis protein CcsA [Flavipsychrobacter sp.]|nr:cytochrome c biogenesis protein CcsA [Flavipsychrobacter sp.]